MLGNWKSLSQTSYVFLTLAAIASTGLLLLIVQAFGQASWGAGWHYLFIGGLTALGALSAGGLVGLIFGLPETAPVVVASPPAGSGDGATTPPPAPAAGDWYRDSSALERIATWLTGAIIALSLANFDSWTARFDQTALSIGLAMQSATPADLAAAADRAATAAAAAKAVARTKGEAEAAYAQRRRDAAEAARLAKGEVLRATSEAQVPGGLLLGGYGLLGFLASYLWTRRYLPAELAKARRDMRDQARLDATDEAALARTQSGDLAQKGSKTSTDPDAAASAVAVARATEAAAAPKGADSDEAAQPETLPFVPPGPIQNDPWKGQFGGVARSATAEIAATVREVTGRAGVFLVALVIRGRTAADHRALAGTELRLYLHPTFPQPIIRPLTFDPNGVVSVEMSAVGAFTVGVQLMSTGETLELDLSELRDAPAAFRLN